MFQYSLTGKDGSGFGSWNTVLAVPVPLSVSRKTVPVSGSGSVPEPLCHCVEALMVFADTSDKLQRTLAQPAVIFIKRDQG